MWALVKILATNEVEYDKLLPNTQNAAQKAQFWRDTFNDTNEYKKIYKQEIILDLMENLDVDEERRVKWKFGYSQYKENV